MPGLEEREAEHESEERLAERESGGGPLDGQQPRQRGGREGEDADLEAPGGEVPEGEIQGAHRLSLMRRARASSSSTVRCSSSTRWARRGAADPPNTRWTNSRTIEPTTWCCGLVGR